MCQLDRLGQSVWLEFMTRDFLRSGLLGNLVAGECVTGMTTNPTIFEQAMTGSDAYDADIGRLARENVSIKDIYYRLMTGDVAQACKALSPVNRETGGADGFVSIEVAPEHAYDIKATVEEALALAAKTGDPDNLMVGVPGTLEGLEAARRLTAAGFNVNVTLLFCAEQCVFAAEAYMAGLEDRLAQDLPIRDVASVASLFVSRIDTLIDPMLDQVAEEAGPARAQRARALRGRIGTATVKAAYNAYNDLLQTTRWKSLAAEGARPQRALWASTGTKNPAYSDIKYVEELIGLGTVSTLPLETLEAFRDHGTAEPTLTDGLDEAQKQLAQAGKLGFNLPGVYSQLQLEGIEDFARSYDHLLSVLEDKCRRLKAA